MAIRRIIGGADPDSTLSRLRPSSALPDRGRGKQSMFNDVQLMVFANALGVTIFILIVLYHYLAVNNNLQRPLN